MFSSASNIRVIVHWAEQTVFAGENIECQIIFKNAAAVPNAQRSSTVSDKLNAITPGTRERKSMPLQTQAAQGKNNISQISRAGTSDRGHRSTLSLNVPVDSQRSNYVAGPKNSSHSEEGGEERSHKRSVSIISLGISEGPKDETHTNHGAAERSERPSRGHVRASSLQIVPRRSGTNGAGPLSAPFSHRSSTQPLSSFHTTPNAENVIPYSDPALSDRPVPGRHPSVIPVSSIPSNYKGPTFRRKGSASFPQHFKFPASHLSMADHYFPDHNSRNDEGISPRTAPSLLKVVSPRPNDDVPAIKEQTSSLTRFMSPIVNGETPRSSGEFYTLSNNSTETLASEYLPHQPGRMQQRGGVHTRRISNIATNNQTKAPETLMMGYAQVQGSFTLDGSLVNQAPFEEIKRKGVLGGQGGGVVGVETSKRNSGLLGGLRWGNIGESLGGLLSGGELSSIKDMRGLASSKSIPLLSTPQSILFVDLRLAPGESQSYNYKFRLPRGLPPSHRGKAIKILYNLVIGIQRPGGTKEQQIKSVEVPFRVLGSVNGHGELLGHDLMSPYIILRDQALIQCLDDAAPKSTMSTQGSKFVKTIETTQSSRTDFLAYVNDLLTRPRQNSSLGLLSPTETRASRRQSSVTEPSSAKDAIDLAILRSNLATDSQHSANRFEISRSGKRVAVAMLIRPAYRLGETITAAIEFTGASIPCYALHASLETSEKVDGAIALRSDASIRRVTRKIYSSHSEATLFASRVVFTPTIPSTATPTFITSGVSLDWKIVIEFVTPRSEALEHNLIVHDQELLEEISSDDRGVVLAAVEGIECETFEVVVPLQVYGALVGVTEKEDETKGLTV